MIYDIWYIMKICFERVFHVLNSWRAPRISTLFVRWRAAPAPPQNHWPRAPRESSPKRDAKKCRGWTAADCLVTSNCAIVIVCYSYVYSIYMYVYIYIHTVYVCMCIYIYMYIYIYTYVCVYIYIHIYSFIYLSIYSFLHLLGRVFICFGTWIDLDSTDVDISWYFFVVIPWSFVIAICRLQWSARCM